jgi:hypothetical protein
MRFGSVLSVAFTVGVVLGALGVMAYDMVQFVRGVYVND